MQADTCPEINEDDALALFCKWAAIPGRSGEERAIAAAIQTALIEAGVDSSSITTDDAHERTPLRGDVGNLIVTLPGDESLPRTMLSAHMDTVPICIGSQPELIDHPTDLGVNDGAGRIVRATGDTGLGADDRSGCAVIATAIRERMRYARTQPNASLPPAVITFLIQEEIGLKGARFLDVTKIGRVDRAFNFDGGTMETVRHGAIGGERMEIRIGGLASHAGVAPQKGINAITIASVAIADLHRRGWLGLVHQPEGVGTANVGVIRGGDATNVVTPEVMLQAEARSHDGAFRERISDEIRSAFEQAARSVRDDQGRGGTINFNSQVDYEAFELPQDHPSVQAANDLLASLGYQPRCELANGGLDANWLFQHNIEAVTLGCGQSNIHTVNEILQVDHFLDACRVATMLLTVA